MNNRFFKPIAVSVAVLFAVATINAQDAKMMYIMKGGAITHEIAVSDIDSIIFYKPAKPLIKGCTVNTIGGGTLTFMCYNLGANENMSIEEQMAYPSPIGNNVTDATVYGDLYQWGRPTDGHEKRTSGTTSTLAATNTPGHGNFILAPSTPYDWRSGGGQTSRWGDGTTNATMPKAANDPCPAGWRMPTQAEWGSILDGGTNWKSGIPASGYTSASGNFWVWNSSGTPGWKISPDGGSTYTLFLPAAGNRYYFVGTLSFAGTNGFYWSSSVDGSNSYSLYFYSSSVSPGNSYYRAYGFACRCVAEY